MTSIDIYSLLSSKHHNPHYLNRYWKFIQYCQISNTSKVILEHTEKHHILPKAPDLFPEFSEFDLKFTWNKIILTDRQHIIAHHMLYKIFGKSQITAFVLMSTTKKGEFIKSSKVLAILREEFRKRQSLISSTRNLAQVAHGTHLFLTESHKINMTNTQQELVNNNLHHWQTPEHSQNVKSRLFASVINGTHPWKSEEHSIKMSDEMTKRNKELIDTNSHHWQTSEHRESQRNVTTSKSLRKNVIILREFIKINKIKLGSGWYLKSDDWINNKIIELKEIR